MTVRIEKSGVVWTVIHSRPEARNAMDPDSAKALYDAFLEFDADDNAAVAVFWMNLSHLQSSPSPLMEAPMATAAIFQWERWGRVASNSTSRSSLQLLGLR